MDYFNARHFSAVLGSMMQPDPGNAGGDIMNPQSWNAYGYVPGNPLGLVDPSGMCSLGGDGYYHGDDNGPCVAPGNNSVSVDGGSVDEISLIWVLSGSSAGGSSPPGAANLPPVRRLSIPLQLPTAPTQLTACQSKTLNAINTQFGTNLTAANVLPTSDPNPQANGGQVNTNFGVSSGLSASQFNAISSGRYAPGGFWGFVTGYGSSLHVVGGRSTLDPTAMKFANSNVGGVYSAQFTAHIDSAWANNPFGAIIHWYIDVRDHGSHRQPC